MGLTAALEQQLAPYSPAGETLSAQIDTLAHQIHTFSHLAAQEEARQKRLREAEQALSLLQTRLSDFLLPYFPQGLPEDLTGAVSQLALDCRAYRDAVARVEERDRRRAKRAEDLAACDETLKEFWQTYRLTQDPREPEVLATLRKDLQQFTLLHTELERYERAEKAFRLEHAALLEQPLEQVPGDPQALAQLESQLTEQLRAAEKAIASGEQEQRSLASQVDTIPELEDQLIRLRESMEADIRRSQLLDQTLAYLQEAKDSLTTRYLGPIQGYFQDYLHRITGEEQKNIAISTELEVTLSRRGQQRAMVNFSAGQADIVWICMHLALADAMFQEDGSPIILDDPFVNLDDRNLDQALELLKDLATSHQILYLTCHTGRTHPD